MGRGLAHTAERLRCNERTLRRYVNDGLLRAERVGRREVRLPRSEEDYLRRHWELLSALRRALRTEHGVRLAVLFGSTATGEDRPDSDVDLLIEHATGNLRQVIGVRRRLQTALGRVVHVVSLEDAEGSASLLADVLIEGRVVVDRDEAWSRLTRRGSHVLRRAEGEERTTHAAARSAIAAAERRLRD